MLKASKAFFLIQEVGLVTYVKARSNGPHNVAPPTAYPAIFKQCFILFLFQAF